MNGIGAIGSLMADSGLLDILSSSFAGVERLSTDKGYPQCLRALTKVAEVILEPVLRHVDLMA